MPNQFSGAAPHAVALTAGNRRNGRTWSAHRDKADFFRAMAVCGDCEGVLHAEFALINHGNVAQILRDHVDQ